MDTLTPPPKHGLIGHRGTAGLRPENTYCSFRHAADLGLNWVEFDVQLSKDDKWVVMHDDTIDRTTNHKGKIADYTLSQLTTFEAGLWFKPPYPNEPIPSLIDTLLLCRTFGLQANIEIKGSNAAPQKYADLMVQFLKENFAGDYVPPMISSFDLDCIVALRNKLPEHPIGYLVDYYTPHTIPICQANNFNSINCDVTKFNMNDLRSSTEAGIPVLLYTINDPATAKLWLDAGVVAVFTDRPDLLLNCSVRT